MRTPPGIVLRNRAADPKGYPRVLLARAGTRGDRLTARPTRGDGHPPASHLTISKGCLTMCGGHLCQRGQPRHQEDTQPYGTGRPAADCWRPTWWRGYLPLGMTDTLRRDQSGDTTALRRFTPSGCPRITGQPYSPNANPSPPPSTSRPPHGSCRWARPGRHSRARVYLGLPCRPPFLLTATFHSTKGALRFVLLACLPTLEGAAATRIGGRHDRT